jgi:DNA-binding NtrC family response regulator
MKKSNKNQELVYLLDDDPVFSHALELWFELQGYRIKVFLNAYSFFKELKHCEPDIVILDFALNENYEGLKTGADVAKRISGIYSKLPIIMLSAQENIQVAVDLFTMQIVDYVVKDDGFHMKLKQSLIRLGKASVLRKKINELKINSRLRLKRIAIAVGLLSLFWTVYVFFI